MMADTSNGHHDVHGLQGRMAFSRTWAAAAASWPRCPLPPPTLNPPTKAWGGLNCWLDAQARHDGIITSWSGGTLQFVEMGQQLHLSGCNDN